MFEDATFHSLASSLVHIQGWLHPSVANFVRYGPKRRHLMDSRMVENCRVSVRADDVLDSILHCALTC